MGGGVHFSNIKIDLSPLSIFVAKCRLSTVPPTANFLCLGMMKNKEKG
jgi:hypothetical protein